MASTAAPNRASSFADSSSPAAPVTSAFSDLDDYAAFEQHKHASAICGKIFPSFMRAVGYLFNAVLILGASFLIVVLALKFNTQCRFQNDTDDIFVLSSISSRFPGFSFASVPSCTIMEVFQAASLPPCVGFATSTSWLFRFFFPL
jgi:hypothetical protein